MPVSLLTLPYELREQILTSLLCKSGSINLQRTANRGDGLTPPISQVCRLLREEALHRVNTFTLTIDPEAVSLDIVPCVPSVTCADFDRIRWTSPILALAVLPTPSRATAGKHRLISRCLHGHGIFEVS
jgi:hypothetical protein